MIDLVTLYGGPLDGQRLTRPDRPGFTVTAHGVTGEYVHQPVHATWAHPCNRNLGGTAVWDLFVWTGLRLTAGIVLATVEGRPPDSFALVFLHPMGV